MKKQIDPLRLQGYYYRGLWPEETPLEYADRVDRLIRKFNSEYRNFNNNLWK